MQSNFNSFKIKVKEQLEVNDVKEDTLINGIMEIQQKLLHQELNYN